MSADEISYEVIYDRMHAFLAEDVGNDLLAASSLVSLFNGHFQTSDIRVPSVRILAAEIPSKHVDVDENEKILPKKIGKVFGKSTNKNIHPTIQMFFDTLVKKMTENGYWLGDVLKPIMFKSEGDIDRKYVNFLESILYKHRSVLPISVETWIIELNDPSLSEEKNEILRNLLTDSEVDRVSLDVQERKNAH